MQVLVLIRPFYDQFYFISFLFLFLQKTKAFLQHVITTNPKAKKEHQRDTIKNEKQIIKHLMSLVPIWESVQCVSHTFLKYLKVPALLPSYLIFFFHYLLFFYFGKNCLHCSV